jgi:hypothetical protein
VPSQIYYDIVGSPPREWPRAYSIDVILRDCPRCHAPSYRVCRNVLTGGRAHLPCLARCRG